MESSLFVEETEVSIILGGLIRTDGSMQGPQPSRDPRTAHFTRLVYLFSVPYGLPSIFVMFKSRDEKYTFLVKFSFLHAEMHIIMCFHCALLKCAVIFIGLCVPLDG